MSETITYDIAMLAALRFSMTRFAGQIKGWIVAECWKIMKQSGWSRSE
jgi:hypothetical protein